jgi:Xaa-Pro aminopeptidase
MDMEYKRFPKEEYERRWERARTLMKDHALDALLVTEANNFTYLSGGHGDFSFSRPTVMILPQKGQAVMIVHEFFEPSQRRESWINEIRSYPSITSAPIDMIKGAIQEIGLTGGKIGAELGREQRLGLPFNDFIELTRILPGVAFLDASDVFWGMRMVKSEAEIACMRRAGEITGSAFKRCFERAREGMTEKEAAKILLETAVAAGGSQVWVLSNSGPYNYESGFLSSPGNYQLEMGNLLWLDSGCSFKGYASDFSRMAAIGKASDKQKSMYASVDRITETVTAAVRPGITASALSRLCNAEFEKAGLKAIWGEGDCTARQSNRANRIGHGIGMATTEPPHIALFDDTVLIPGMVITIEPTVVTGYGHFNIESNVLVTGDGFEVLSQASRELLVI